MASWYSGAPAGLVAETALAISPTSCFGRRRRGSSVQVRQSRRHLVQLITDGGNRRRPFGRFLTDPLQLRADFGQLRPTVGECPLPQLRQGLRELVDDEFVVSGKGEDRDPVLRDLVGGVRFEQPFEFVAFFLERRLVFGVLPPCSKDGSVLARLPSRPATLSGPGGYGTAFAAAGKSFADQRRRRRFAPPSFSVQQESSVTGPSLPVLAVARLPRQQVIDAAAGADEDDRRRHGDCDFFAAAARSRPRLSRPPILARSVRGRIQPPTIDGMFVGRLHEPGADLPADRAAGRAGRNSPLDGPGCGLRVCCGVAGRGQPGGWLAGALDVLKPQRLADVRAAVGRAAPAGNWAVIAAGSATGCRAVSVGQRPPAVEPVADRRRRDRMRLDDRRGRDVRPGNADGRRQRFDELHARPEPRFAARRHRPAAAPFAPPSPMPEKSSVPEAWACIIWIGPMPSSNGSRPIRSR